MDKMRHLPKKSKSEIEMMISVFVSDPNNVYNEPMLTDICSDYIIDGNDVRGMLKELQTGVTLGIDKCFFCNVRYTYKDTHARTHARTYTRTHTYTHTSTHTQTDKDISIIDIIVSGQMRVFKLTILQIE